MSPSDQVRFQNRLFSISVMMGMKLHVLRTEYRPRSENFSMKFVGFLCGLLILWLMMTLNSGCSRSEAQEPPEPEVSSKDLPLIEDPNPNRTWTIDPSTGFGIYPSDGHYGFEEKDL